MLTAAAAPGTTSSAALDRRWLRVRVGDAFAAVVGMLSAVEVKVVGRLYLGEAALAVIALGLPFMLLQIPATRARAWLVRFLVGAAGYIVCLVLTDLYRGTQPTDFARGWFRALLFVTNVIGLLALGWQRRARLTYWLAGLSVGILLVQAIHGDLTVANWKFGASLPLTTLLLCSIDMRRPRIGYALLGFAAFVHLLLDYRSLAAFCLVTMLLLLLAQRRLSRGGRPFDPVLVGVGTLSAAAFAALYLANVGLTSAGDDLVDRRAGSNIERYAGFVVGAEVIARSPFIGYGSWPRNDEIFSEWAQLQEDLGSALSATTLVEASQEKGEDGLIKTHSQVLQGWVEAGIPGLVFFVLLLVGTTRLLWLLVTANEVSSGLALPIFWCLWTMWALMFSPFSGPVRLQNAISFVLAFGYVFGVGRELGSPRP